MIISAVFKGARCDASPLWPDREIFLQATLYEKVRFCHFPARIANQFLMVLKSPCAIASDMTPESPNAFENQLQAV